mmetsp:Transcript_60826/g.199156  ORF Transcript_60826/g.199156 Transcript_60826/m.199156 type:complete len:236 (+) Transcript_60826:974-1681(+)
MPTPRRLTYLTTPVRWPPSEDVAMTVWPAKNGFLSMSRGSSLKNLDLDDDDEGERAEGGPKAGSAAAVGSVVGSVAENQPNQDFQPGVLKCSISVGKKLKDPRSNFTLMRSLPMPVAVPTLPLGTSWSSPIHVTRSPTQNSGLPAKRLPPRAPPGPAPGGPSAAWQSAAASALGPAPGPAPSPSERAKTDEPVALSSPCSPMLHVSSESALITAAAPPPAHLGMNCRGPWAETAC